MADNEAGTWTGWLADEAATATFGAALGHAARPGDALALEGALGAGKTTLTRALTAAYGLFDPAEFASPTYTYLNPYPGPRGEVLHFDFYRLNSEDDAWALGLEDQLGRADALCVIEWAGALPTLVPPAALWLRLTADPERGGRRWQGWAGPVHLQAVLARLGQATPTAAAAPGHSPQ